MTTKLQELLDQVLKSFLGAVVVTLRNRLQRKATEIYVLKTQLKLSRELYKSMRDQNAKLRENAYHAKQALNGEH